MALLTIDKVSFTADDLIVTAKRGGKSRAISEEMFKYAKQAYKEGSELLTLKAIVEFYDKDEIETGGESIAITASGKKESILIGKSAGYLFPANVVAIAICTAGAKLVEAMDRYANDGEYLMMYNLDMFGVKALGEMSQKVREYVTAAAVEKGWGVGPQMQPGSAAGWEVSGQKDLFRLAHGERLGLSLNESCFLVPRISDSMLIGMGPHYDKKHVSSLCGECPRFKECLWRKENIDK